MKPRDPRLRRRVITPALLIVDMISDFRFPDGTELFRHAFPVAHRIARLKERLMPAGVPVIYVNDNFDEWHANFATTIDAVEKSSDEGKEIVNILRPTSDSYYVLKPERSGFYKTPLGVLLRKLEVNQLIVTGITTDICVLFTANDAYMRGFSVVVPADCTAAVKEAYHRQALDMLKRNTDADVRLSPWVIPPRTSRKK